MRCEVDAGLFRRYGRVRWKGKIDTGLVTWGSNCGSRGRSALTLIGRMDLGQGSSYCGSREKAVWLRLARALG